MSVVRIGLAFTLWLCGSALCATAADEVDLSWRFKKGQVLDYLLRHREIKTVSIGDQKLETTTSSEYDLRWTVIEVDAKGTATLAQKITGLRVAVTGKDFEFQYDSARGNQADDDYKRKLIAFLDQIRFADYQIEIEPTGRVVRVQGFDRLLTEAGSGNQVVDYHGLYYRDGPFAWLLQQTLGQVPITPTGKGKRWEVPVEARWEGIGQLAGRSTFQLVGPSTAEPASIQDLKVLGQQSLELDTKWLNTGLRGPLKSTKLDGTIHIDTKAHRAKSSEIVAELGGDLKFGSEEKPAELNVKFQHTLSLLAQN